MTRGVRSIAKGWLDDDIFQLPQLQFLQTLFRHHQFKYQDGSSTSKERIKPQTSKSFTTFRVTFLSYSMVVVLELRAGAWCLFEWKVRNSLFFSPPMMTIHFYPSEGSQHFKTVLFHPFLARTTIWVCVTSRDTNNSIKNAHVESLLIFFAGIVGCSMVCGKHLLQHLQ